MSKPEGLVGKPWEIQEEETPKAFAAFCAYRDMGHQRSIGGASGKASAPRAWREWSVRHRWVERVAAYDEHLASVAVAVAEDCVKSQAAAYRARVLREAGEIATAALGMLAEAKGIEDRVLASLVAQRGVSIWEKAHYFGVAVSQKGTLRTQTKVWQTLPSVVHRGKTGQTSTAQGEPTPCAVSVYLRFTNP